ncbi:MAG: sigma-54 dependent transcriptional regulator [Chromatiales bacterium]|nr:sigma-54 dependent transcriptional regulator [Chromatiales bacterium]
MSKILIVDDDTASCRTLQLHFSGQGFEVVIAHDVESGLATAERESPNLIILDIRMPGRSGLEGLPDFKLIAPKSRVIMITAFHDMESTIQAMQKGADDYIHKPIDIDELDESVARLLLVSNVNDTTISTLLEQKQNSKMTMVGRSRSMKEVFKTIGLAASSPATILITGESGTGKELVARAIHRSSANPDGPFVAVNCAALVETLLESDMFGHEKGSFTGAINRQVGKFALARGGTIFLDEVGEMPPAIQAKLLRVLQDKEFIPVGGKMPETTDARIIAATNVDLKLKVKESQFREDLFYRLQVINIDLPPLRERSEDILDLVQTLLSRINKELQRNVTSVSMEVIDIFHHHSWPGNVRELENILMKAVALSSGNILTADQLPPHILSESDQYVVNFTPTSKPTHELTLQEMEMRHIKAVLEANSWHRGNACEVLGISRPRLRRMMQHYDIAPPNGLVTEEES